MATRSGTIAADLRRRIEAGEWVPGESLPSHDELAAYYDVARMTMREAIRVLSLAGVVSTVRGVGTYVRARIRVRMRLERYATSMNGASGLGPWETACAEQGLAGEMRLMHVDTRAASIAQAGLLEVRPGSDVVYRRRHGLIPPVVYLVQESWYPVGVIAGTGLDQDVKIVGGVMGAFRRAGRTPDRISETVRVRPADDAEITLLHPSTGQPLLCVETIVRDADNTVIELRRLVGAADLFELTYSDLPIDRESPRDLAG